MERKIGEIFELQNEWYKVVDDPKGTCRGCAFIENPCNSYKEIIGFCSEDGRNDGTSIIFIKADKPVGIINSDNKKKLLLFI